MKTERLFNFCYAIGAAVVIYGAWLKITHRPMADFFLTVGLLTEVVMFILTAVQELLRKQPDQYSTAAPNVSTTSNNDELAKNVNQLNQTIKKVFNQ